MKSKVRYPKAGELWCYENEHGGFIFAEIQDYDNEIKDNDLEWFGRWKGEYNTYATYATKPCKENVSGFFKYGYSPILRECWVDHYRAGRLTYIGKL